MGYFIYSHGKLCFCNSYNRIKITNEKIINAHINKDQDFIENISLRLNDIINEIGNKGIYKIRMHHNPYIIMDQNQITIDESDTNFRANNVLPRNGFMINSTRYVHGRYNSDCINIYVVQNFKKTLIIKYYCIYSSNVIFINYGSKHMMQIKNRKLTKLIVYVLDNCNKSIIDELEQLVDTYVGIVYLIEQMNVIPVAVKSARN